MPLPLTVRAAAGSLVLLAALTAAGSATPGTQAAASSAATVAGPVPDTAVRLVRRVVDPQQLGHLGPATGTRRGAALTVVQFTGPPQDRWRVALERTGARIVQYMASDAYLVRVPPARRAALEAWAASAPEVRGAFPLTGADKVAPGVPTQGPAAVVVQSIAGAPGQAVRTAAAALGVPLAATATLGRWTTQALRLDATAIPVLAADPGTVAVIPYTVPAMLDERQDLLAADLATGPSIAPPGTYLPYALGLDPATSSTVVDVTDSGLDSGTTTPAHPVFYVAGDKTAGSRVAYQHDFTGEAQNKDCTGHGTLNASIIGGDSRTPTATVGAVTKPAQDALGYQYALGVAPTVRLGASRIFDCAGQFTTQNGFSPAAVADQAYAGGARISSNSWGAPDPTGYDQRSQAYDALVRDARPGVPGSQPLVEVFAAGNAGATDNAIGSPGTAKNVITVGAAEGQRAFGTDGCGITDAGADNVHQVAPFSSRGPTGDGRLKPDLVAPGTHVAGARSTAATADVAPICGTTSTRAGFNAPNALFTASSGTSQAAPIVAGAAALTYDVYARRTGAAPSPAMVKALLLNGTVPLGDGWPNEDAGFGLVSVPGATALDDVQLRDQRPDDLLTDSGQVHTYAVHTLDASKPVRITLAWTDPPGALGSPQVNDLDLVVRAGGATYRGGRSSGRVSEPDGEADHVDTVESVLLPAGTPRDLLVTVAGTTIAGDGVPGTGDGSDQDFALVAGNVGAPSAVSAGVPTVTTGDATAISTTGATLAGTADPGGLPATTRFEYGPTTAYGSTTPDVALPAAGPIGATISGLTPGTTYHARALLVAAGVPIPGGDRTFTTPPAPMPVAPSSVARITAASVIRLPSSRSCLKHRRVTFRIRAPSGRRVLRVRVSVNGHLRRTVTGSRLLRPITITRLPRGKVRLTVVATLSDGRRLTLRRTYRTCAVSRHKR